MHISERMFMLFDAYSVNSVTLGAWIRLFYEIFLRTRLLGRYLVSVSLYASVSVRDVILVYVGFFRLC